VVGAISGKREWMSRGADVSDVVGVFVSRDEVFRCGVRGFVNFCVGGGMSGGRNEGGGGFVRADFL